MNRLALIRWPNGNGGSGSGGTTVTAANGLSILAGVVVLGQTVNQLGNPGKLITPRELPFNGQSILFSGIGSVPGSHLIFKKDSNADNILEPFFEFQDSAGVLMANLRITKPGGSDISTFFTDTGAPTLIGRGNFVWGSHAMLNGTTARDTVAIGANAGWSITTAEKNVIIGSDAFNTGFIGNIGIVNLVLGTNNYDDGASNSIGNANVIVGGFNGNFANNGVLGSNNIILGVGNFLSAAFPASTDRTIIIGNGIFTPLSNICVLGDTQHVIIGGTVSPTDSGDQLQVYGTVLVGTIPGTNNLKTLVAWDHVTHKLVDASGATVIFTADNGLNVNAPNNAELGGLLLKTTTITTGAFQMIFDGSAGPTNTLRVINTTNTAIRGETTSGNAVFGIATTGVGGQFNTTSGSAAIQGFSTNSLGGNFANGPASTNTVVTVVGVQRGTTGTAADGIGASIDISLTTTTTPNVLSNQIISKWTTANNPTRTSEFSITGVNSGSTNVLLTISGAGIFTLTQGLGNFVNDAAAAAGGVPVNGLYRNGSVVQIRVS